MPTKWGPEREVALEKPWIDYSVEQPAEAGVYAWSVPSAVHDGLRIEFLATHRKRGAGYKDVLSPSFDRWDGYSVHVPAGTRWMATDKTGERILNVEGVSVEACPFCRKVPQWHGTRKSGQYAILGHEPHTYNVWWLECCSWAKTPHMDDPRALVSARSDLLAFTRKQSEVIRGLVALVKEYGFDQDWCCECEEYLTTTEHKADCALAQALAAARELSEGS